MKFVEGLQRRRSIRLRDYDYAGSGAYFVTICVQGRDCLLGGMAAGGVVANAAGSVVCSVWEQLPERFPGVTTDAFIVMPNHLHGIVMIDAATDRGAAGLIKTGATKPGAMNCAPTVAGVVCVGARFIAPHGVDPACDSSANGAHGPTLGEIVRVFKAVSARLIRRDLIAEFAWQRNYYEHIVRDGDELQRVREYIAENPARWGEEVP